MPNFLNGKPIRIVNPMAQSFWATLRNLGVLDASIGKPILVDLIEWDQPGVSAQFVITDASASANVLAQGSTPASFTGPTVEKPFSPARQWRDWQVTQLTAGTLIIHYH